MGATDQVVHGGLDVVSPYFIINYELLHQFI
jgi:hypothetical protein